MDEEFDASDEESPAHAERKAIHLSKESILTLLEASLTIGQIAVLCGVSASTIKLFLRKNGMKKKDKRSNITDEELQKIVSECALIHPYWGVSMLRGHLRGLGLSIERYRLLEAIKHCDPDASLLRQRKMIKRRVYYVKSPNSLWHMDGNEKLKTWGIYIHGAIDGYSRLPLHIQVSTNKRSATVFRYFMQSVRKYGLPSRVRVDKGRENIGVAMFMLNHPDRGPGRGSCLTGPSTRNQHIERFWRDVFKGCTVLFHNLFTKLETEGFLDVGSIDLIALHHVYLLPVQNEINRFVQAWRNHPMRTAKNLSPLQLFSQPKNVEDNELLGVETMDHIDLEIEESGRICDVPANSLENVPAEILADLDRRFPPPLKLDSCFLQETYNKVRNYIRNN